MRLGSIYSLKDPKTGLVRYIGSTICNPKRRYDQHIYQWKRVKGRMTRINAWIKHLAKYKHKPILDILEINILEGDLDTKERNYIFLYKSLGARLCNHVNGRRGISGYVMSEESKNKRLKSLSTSKAWEARNKRHSILMKQNYSKPVVPKHTKETKIKIAVKAKSNLKGLEALAQARLKLKKKVQVENILFNSITEAAKFIGVVPNSVRNACREKRFCKGFKVQFENKTQHELKSKGKASSSGSKKA